MIKPIVTDSFFLSQKSDNAIIMDTPVIKDLLDTLEFNRYGCVGMAANMIGIKKRIIAFENHGKYSVMLNPEITEKSGVYTAEEGCISHDTTKETTRYKTIKVKYQTADFKNKEEVFTGWTAEIIQHEIDHCNGILI